MKNLSDRVHDSIKSPFWSPASSHNSAESSDQNGYDNGKFPSLSSQSPDGSALHSAFVPSFVCPVFTVNRSETVA